MAKAKAAVEEGLQTRVKKAFVTGTEHGIADVARMSQEGYEMTFDPEHFIDLPENVVRELGFDNRRQYWMAFGLHKGMEKAKASGNDGKSERIQVMSPLSGNPSEALKVQGMNKNEVPVWKRPDEVEWCLSKGYRRVTNDEKDVFTPAATKAGSSRVIRDSKGKEDDLVLLAVDRNMHEQHLEAVSLKSRLRTKGVRDQTQENLARMGVKTKVTDESYEEAVQVVVDKHGNLTEK